MIYITCACAGHAFYQLLLSFLPLLSFPPAALFSPCLSLSVRSVYYLPATLRPRSDMTLRTVSASWSGMYCVSNIYTSFIFTRTVAASHAVVLFKADDSVSIVPVKRIIEENVQVQQPCSVRWTDDAVYEGTLQAIGP